MPHLPVLTLSAPLAGVIASVDHTEGADPRELGGLALPFGAAGRTNMGLVTARSGVLTWPADLRRVKVFRGHGRTHPVGYVTHLSETPGGLYARFHLAATPDGDTALLEAREGAVDALSVELDDVDLADDGAIRSAQLTGLALVPLPAFDDARLAAGDTQPDGAPDGDDDDDDESESEDMPDTATPDAPAAPQLAAQAPPALLATRAPAPHEMTLEAACARVAQLFQASDRSAAALNAALADVTPTSTGYTAAAPYQWIGEVWTPEYVALDWVQAVSAAVLTGMKVTGWKRVPPSPVISPYAGNKAEIPTDANIHFAPVTVDAVRHAVGADFDRVFIDFGDESVIATWLTLVSQSYAQVLDDEVGTAALAAASDAGDFPDFVAAVSGAANALRKAGGTVSFIAVAADLFGDFLNMSTATAPWWLTGSSSVSLAGRDGTVNDLRIFESPALAAGTVLAGDRRAVTQYTPRGNPFQVRAVDLPKGGLDVAVFGYSATLVNNAAGLQLASVVVVP